MTRGGSSVRPVRTETVRHLVRLRISRTVAVVGAIALCLAAGGAAATVALTSVGAGSGPDTVTISDTACAPGWVPPRSGQTVFTVDNVSRDTVFGVDLVGANQVSVYGEIEMLAPGTDDQMTAVLPPGTYSFECESFAGSTLYSQPAEVSGPPVTDAHPYTPPELAQVQQATVDYQASLIPYLDQLQTDTDALTQAVDHGNLTEARSLWLPAHLDYARLGAAYDTFGNFNTEIDGRPLGLRGGVDDPSFEGFLRLEFGLWNNQPASELVPVADALDTAVHGLVSQFPSMVMPMNDLSLRTHEILENTLQFELTGETDEGSNTNLATAWANAQGTELALAALTPLLQSLAPSLLNSLSSGLQALTAEFKSYELPDGSWTPVQSLTTSQRERLDGSVGALLEQLSNVPDLLDLPIMPESPND